MPAETVDRRAIKENMPAQSAEQLRQMRDEIVVLGNSIYDRWPQDCRVFLFNTSRLRGPDEIRPTSAQEGCCQSTSLRPPRPRGRGRSPDESANKGLGCDS
jgi:hypothetical protein